MFVCPNVDVREEPASRILVMTANSNNLNKNCYYLYITRNYGCIKEPFHRKKSMTFDARLPLWKSQR
jgi:hypothetical protein